MIILLTFIRAIMTDKINTRTVGDGVIFGIWVAGIVEMAMEYTLLLGVAAQCS